MSDVLTYRSGGIDGQFGLLRSVPNYRQTMAALIPSAYMAYAVLIWPLLFAKQYTADEFTQGPTSGPAGTILSTLLFPTLCGLAILLFVNEYRRWPRPRIVPALAVVAFWSFLGLSTRWSLTPAASLKDFLVLTLGLVGLGLSTAMVDSMARILRPLFWVLMVAMLVNLAAVLLTPPGPIGHEGIYIHKNDLGGIAAIGIIFALYGLGLRSMLYRLASLLAVAAWCLILLRSDSKTSMGLVLVAPVLGMGAVFARRYLRIALPVLLVVAIPVVWAIFSGLVPGFSQADLSQLVGGDKTFTGRVEVWEFVIHHLAGRPLGYGFHSFWTFEVGSNSPTIHGAFGFLQKAPSSHNGYLELLLWGGWPLLALFGLIMACVAGWIGRIASDDPWLGWVLVSLLIFFGLHNLLESTWFSDNSIHSVLVYILIAATVTTRPARPPERLVRLI